MAQTSPDARPDRAVWLAANNGDIGGGEVMLLRTAEAIRELDLPVGVVAPTGPSGVADAARDAGFVTAALAADGRRQWMSALRSWDRTRTGVLWCHGLVPATATAGRPNRIVHLHQPPQNGAQTLLVPVARRGALVTLVPSRWMQSRIRRAEVLANWTDDIDAAPRGLREVVTIGYLGRLSLDKGVDVLAEAMATLQQERPDRWRLLVAGEPRFVSPSQQAAVESALAPLAGLVERPGWMAREDFFDEVDVVVMPSVWPESFGLSAAEAMAAGRPLVVTRSGALPEVVGEPASLIVPPSDPVALADTVRQLIDGAVPDGVASRRGRWTQEYSPAAGRARVSALLERVMGTAGHRPG